MKKKNSKNFTDQLEKTKMGLTVLSSLQTRDKRLSELGFSELRVYLNIYKRQSSDKGITITNWSIQWSLRVE